MKHNFLHLFLGLVLTAGVLTGICFLVPWERVNWGELKLAPAETITVVGTAKTQERSQVASFTAGVNAINDDKETAINEVNQKVAAIIEAVKAFGINEADIQTQNLSIYQQEETFYEEGRQKQRQGQWRVSNSINITLRDVDQASDLAALLTRSGATNVYGPNFRLDDTQEAESGLLDQAIANAREKAEIIAQASDGELGKVISVSEGYQSSRVYPVMLEGAGGGGAPIEPGSETISKTVTVVFELK